MTVEEQSVGLVQGSERVAGGPIWIPWVYGAACCIATIHATYPGYMSFDSAFQFWQVRTGYFSNVSPVTMTLLWRLVDSVWPGPGGLFVLNQAVFWIGVTLVSTLLSSGTGARAVSITLLGLTVPAYLTLLHLWTDAGVVASLTTAFAFVYLAYLKRSRWPLLLALPLLFYGGLVRHNALPAVIPIYVLWAFALFRSRPVPCSRQNKYALVVAAAFLALTFATGMALDRLFAEERRATWPLAMLWDMAGISVRAGRIVLPEVSRGSAVTLDSLASTYKAQSSIWLFTERDMVRSGLELPYSQAELMEVVKAWLASVAVYPMFYLDHRWKIAVLQYGRRYASTPSGLIYSFGVTPYRDNPLIEPNPNDMGRSLQQILERMARWWISAPVLYLGLAGWSILRNWRARTTPRGRFALGAAISGVLYALPLFFIAPSAELRYTAWTCFAGVLSAIIGFARAPGPIRQDVLQ